jgi:cytochrome P450 family 4
MGALLLLTYFVCVISLLLGSVLWPKRKQWLAARKLPGPPGWPFLGNTLQISGNRYHSFKTLVAFITEYGKIFRVWFGPKLVIVLSDPVDIQRIIGDSKIRNRDYIITKAMLPFIGNGLLAARDELWKVHRKLLTPTFHFKVLLTYVEVFGRKSQKLCDTLEEFADGETVDIHKYVSMCTMDAICETAIGE